MGHAETLRRLAPPTLKRFLNGTSVFVLGGKAKNAILRFSVIDLHSKQLFRGIKERCVNMQEPRLLGSSESQLEEQESLVLF